MPHIIDIEQAKLDPSSVFKKPSEVLGDPHLTHQDKIDILQRWAYDQRELAVAEEENMTSSNGENGNLLGEIINCLLQLGIDENNGAPTKQG